MIVNIFTNQAVCNQQITIFGGEQLRPNIHIDDIVDAYFKILLAPHASIDGQVFNVGDRNYTVRELAEMVCDVVGLTRNSLLTVQSNDQRSYHINSTKISKHLGCAPTRGIPLAIEQLSSAIIRGDFQDSLRNPLFFNLSKIKEMEL